MNTECLFTLVVRLSRYTRKYAALKDITMCVPPCNLRSSFGISWHWQTTCWLLFTKTAWLLEGYSRYCTCSAFAGYARHVDLVILTFDLSIAQVLSIASAQASTFWLSSHPDTPSADHHPIRKVFDVVTTNVQSWPLPDLSFVDYITLQYN